MDNISFLFFFGLEKSSEIQIIDGSNGEVLLLFLKSHLQGNLENVEFTDECVDSSVFRFNYRH